MGVADSGVNNSIQIELYFEHSDCCKSSSDCRILRRGKLTIALGFGGILKPIKTPPTTAMRLPVKRRTLLTTVA